MTDVPLDILTNHIFIRLPVRSLLRCRCVCKQWLVLLSEPEFIKMHFKHQKIHNHQKILFRPRYYNKINPCVSDDYDAKFKALRGVFYSLDLESSSSSSSSSSEALRLPGFQLKDYGLIRTLGYCSGMLCMEVRNWVEEDYRKSKHLLFGNPSTGDFKILSEPIIGPLLAGFGYDSSLDDYKFVRVDNITRNPHIFSLKLNSWRTILGSSDNNSIKPRRKWYIHNVGFALDGSIYWLVEISNKIVAFDLKDDKFRELPLPRDMPRDKRNNKLSTKNVGGSLCIINICQNNKVTMWLMLKEEENNKEKYCWIKSMTVTLSSTDFWGFFDFYPLSFMKDENVLCCVHHRKGCKDLINGKVNYVVINPITKRIQDFTIHWTCGDSFRDCTLEALHTTYIDSLVSPH